jgi:Crinkler effector protein N-terminal domain
MADDEIRVLWCLIQGESTPFEVIAPVNVSINQLKKLIKEEGIDVTERDTILAKHMTLWKVSIEQPA